MMLLTACSFHEFLKNGAKRRNFDRGWGAPRFNPKATAQPYDGIAPGAKLLFELLDSLLPTLSIDRKRIYVTGQSLGGYGSFYVVMKRPGLFAAAVPVCGGGAPAEANKFRGVPLWVFHGKADTVVPVQRSREMVEGIRTWGGSVALTEYEGVGHNSWEFAYSEQGLLNWLYAQHK